MTRLLSFTNSPFWGSFFFFLAIGWVLFPIAIYAQDTLSIGGSEPIILKPSEKPLTDKKEQVVGQNNAAAGDKTATLPAQEDAPAKKDSIYYDASTTHFFYEDDLYYNTQIKRNPDTLVNDFHRYNVVEINDYLYQDLGNWATAATSIFYQMPEEIGTRWGMNAYRAFIKRPEQIQYFNTMSPYTRLYLIQGGQRRSNLDITFSRNITPDWNVTLFYNRMSSNKVVFKTFRRNDDLNVNQSLGFNTAFQSRNHRYKLLGHFVFYNQNLLETGGLEATQPIKVGEGGNYIDSLLELESSELRYRFPQPVSVNAFGRNFRLYHQYSLTKKGELELFHRSEFRQDFNIWQDANFNQNRNSYRQTFFDAAKVTRSFYRNDYQHFDNRIGIKGRAKDFQYRTYLRQRTYDQRATFLKDSSDVLTDSARLELPAEWFVGGGMRYFLDTTNTSWVDAQAEYLPVDAYKMQLFFNHKNISLQAERQNYRPDVIQRAYFGNHFKWNDDSLRNTIADRFSFSFAFEPFKKGLFPTKRRKQNVAEIDLGLLQNYDATQVQTFDSLLQNQANSAFYLRLEPFVEYTRLNRLIYYDTMAQRQQAQGVVSQFRVGTNFRAQWKSFHFKGSLFYAASQGQDIWRVPAFFANVVGYYESALFNNAMQAHIGLDIHYHTRYRAFAYQPITGQFHVQDEALVGNYPLVSAFFDFKVKRALLFFKIVNLLQDVAGKGYYTTPYYIAQPRAFEFGLQWLFFD